MCADPSFRTSFFPFPLHSVLVSRRGVRIQEDYFSPCSETALHRMFSIAKSYTALAVCALTAEGKLHPEDPIIRYFPDLTPRDPHPWLTCMTIQDLLDMKTCHASTTYKLNPAENWVRSFFITPPDHRSGQIFKYDTGAAHVLASLVRRVSGKGVLDYLRDVFLDGIGFSREAYMMKDPFGDEIGGSGLMARSSDLMVTAEFLMALWQNRWKQPYRHLLSDRFDEAFFLRFRDLFLQCVSFRSATVHEGKTLEECQGYGSQFWRIRNGFAMYGMGGQYAAFFPEEDLIIVTTADTQAMQGGTQLILDEMYRTDHQFRNPDAADAPVSTAQVPESHGDAQLLEQVIDQLAGSYSIQENPQGFISCTILRDEAVLVHRDCTFRFPIFLSDTAEITDPKYHQKLYITTSPLKDGSLYQYIQILDSYVGSIRITYHGSDGKLTIHLHKIEECVFPEMNGFLEAEKTAD